MWHKIIVDILMTIFLVLSFVRFDSDYPAFHFTVGIGCTIFFAAHIFIHRKWIKVVTKSCLVGKLKKSLKWKYIVNMLLLVVWGISIATGFLAIMFDVGNIHGLTARIGAGLVIIHIIQHWAQIKSYFVRKRKT